ncbi:MAG: M56 family metallopeptidase [Planctomycetota bacterium]|nr:M56 family metallopeptidase [Planctomycetota bacterium]
MSFLAATSAGALAALPTGPLGVTSASALAVLATYLIHSTLLFGGAWLAARSLRHPRLRELCWKAALVGSLVTTGLQVGLGGPLTLDVTTPVVAIASEAPIGGPGQVGQSGLGDPGATPMEPGSEAAPLGLELDESARAALAQGQLVPGHDARGGHSPFGLLSVGESQPLLPWHGWLLLGIGLLALVRLVTLARQVRRLRGLIARSDRIRRGPLFDHVREQRVDAVLFSSAELGSPLAIGRRTICVPAYALELEHASRAALLDHELEHLRRRDGAWLFATALLSALVPVQPLLRLAMANLRREAELLCDEGAVVRAGDGLALARCLATVAERFEARSLPAWSTAMAGSSSELIVRVERALAEPPRAPSRARLAILALVSCSAIGALACAGPGLQAGEAEPTSSGGDEEPLAMPGSADSANSQGFAVAAVAEAGDASSVLVKLLLLAQGERRVAFPNGSASDKPWTGPEDGAFALVGHEVSYVAEGLTFSGDELGRAGLVDYLRSLGATQPGGGVALQAMQGVVYTDITAVLDALLASGVKKIAFVGASGVNPGHEVGDSRALGQRVSAGLLGEPRDLRLHVSKGRNADGSEVRSIFAPVRMDGTPLRPDREPQKATVELDEHGAIALDGALLVEPDSRDYQPLRARLAELAAGMEQEPLAPGLELQVPGETLCVRAPASAPFARVLQVMVQCGAQDVQISKVTMELGHDSGPDEWFATPLPRDVDYSTELIEERPEEGEEPAPWSPGTPRIDVRIEGGDWTLTVAGADPVRIASSADAVGSRQAFLESARVVHTLYPDTRVTITARPGTSVGQAAELLGTLTEAGMHERWLFTGPMP